MEHIFKGVFITNDEFYNLKPRNVFHRHLERVDLPCDEHRNRHVLFRKGFSLATPFKPSSLYFSCKSKGRLV